MGFVACMLTHAKIHIIYVGLTCRMSRALTRTTPIVAPINPPIVCNPAKIKIGCGVPNPITKVPIITPANPADNTERTASIIPPHARPGLTRYQVEIHQPFEIVNFDVCLVCSFDL